MVWMGHSFWVKKYKSEMGWGSKGRWKIRKLNNLLCQSIISLAKGIVLAYNFSRNFCEPLWTSVMGLIESSFIFFFLGTQKGCVSQPALKLGCNHVTSFGQWTCREQSQASNMKRERVVRFVFTLLPLCRNPEVMCSKWCYQTVEPPSAWDPECKE